MKIHTGDSVIAISGKDKGKTGEVLKTFPKEGKIVVKGIGIVTRHMKPQGGQPGQILKMEKPIDASNVMLVDPKSGKPTRIGYAVKDTKKVRIAKNSGTQL